MNHNDLTNTPPRINYDTSQLEQDQYALVAALDPRHPRYNEIMEECKTRNLSYKIIDGEGKQQHIWVKGWKD